MPRSPLPSILLQATILNAISNLLAQVIDQYQKDAPFTLNTLALLQFITYALIIVPINFSFQNWLESSFPGFPTWQRLKPRKPTPHPSLDLDMDGVAIDILPSVKDKPIPMFQPRKASQRSGTWNFAMKFLLDQTVGSVGNIVLFVVLINLLKGVAWSRTWELVAEDFEPIMIARLKYRPVVSTLMYTVVPVERRVVFGSACGVIWGVYLSLYAAV
ncbi:hypothetical protein P170DRAFT_383857 [Aspergillus steynii IBT 23096]|uniref:Integral membrane protein, Mpv17/PMP22 family n=1 Tax=Aspergillus steynii IBT 23096 TaxID=1392250 RepID=A0A2I2G8I7_9EURO|nr:uncharacterized protein P170DRAFT_383857 [Aspergillus steynii IBT 23096]PLB49197.1 hypothetical protein P170DRAFT_383857 [Aspergillus steynii IBT 23096]